MYDLVLKGGTVVDPSVGLHGVYDIAVQDGTLASIAPSIAREEATRVLEVSGTIVTPGLIDLWDPRPWGWEPDPAPLGAAAFKSCC